MPSDLLSRWKDAVPHLMVAYVLCLAALRLSFSPFLEVDEAQFIGQVDFRLIYGNAEAPLYHWAMRIALEVTGWEWAQAVSLVKFSLLATYYLLIWKLTRRLVDERTAVVAIAAAAFLPQIVWMSAHTLAQSVMVMTGVAAFSHAVLRALQEPSRNTFLWLGFAAALAALARFDFFFFAVAFLIVAATTPPIRERLFRPVALYALVVFAAVAGPSLVAASVAAVSGNGAASAASTPDASAFFDPPLLGVDGLFEFVKALIAWVGPALAVWALARFVDSRSGGNAKTENLFVEALGRTMAAALALLALVILVGDFHDARERDLTPLLAMTPVYLAVAWPLSRTAFFVAPAAAAVYVLAFAGYWGMATYGVHRFAFDYRTIAAPIRRLSEEPLPILSRRADDHGNLILALGWPGATTPILQPLENRAILVWRGRGDAPTQLIPPGFGPGTRVFTVIAPLLNRANAEDPIYSVQRFDRIGAAGN